jgi:hypothetical protein
MLIAHGHLSKEVATRLQISIETVDMHWRLLARLSLRGGRTRGGSRSPRPMYSVRDEVNIYSTYGWHPISVDAAIAKS